MFTINICISLLHFLTSMQSHLQLQGKCIERLVRSQVEGHHCDKILLWGCAFHENLNDSFLLIVH